MKIGTTHILVALSAVFLLLAASALAILHIQQLENEKGGLAERLEATSGDLNATLERLSDSEKTGARLAEELRTKSDELGVCGADLSKTRTQLYSVRRELNETAENLSATASELTQANKAFSQLKGEIGDMQAEISESIQWFRDNSRLPDVRYFQTLKSYIRSECIIDQRIKLGCIAYILQKRMGFFYKTDETGDRLYTLSEMADRKGGDCEDYSLMFKALLNTFKEDGYVWEMETWKPGAGSYFIYQDADYQYFIGNASQISMGPVHNMKPYVVCFNTEYDEKNQVLLGHCIVALSKNEVSDLNIETALEGARLFEPQTGQYLGILGNGLMVCNEGMDRCEKTTLNYVYFVIGDDDLHMFKKDRWVSYRMYLDETGTLLNGTSG
ncbi:MAG: hypothetical protein ACP5NX_00420 [Candidatus Bilamarchaeaceae archaeon]